MKKIITLYFVGLLSIITLHAQDYHFSQFDENPSLINPALTCASQTMRASLHYKNQWKSVTTPYNSYGFSFESKLKGSNWKQIDANRGMTFKKSADKIAAGLSVYNDKAGSNKLQTLQANLSVSMRFPLTKKSTLIFGLQGSVVQRKVDGSQFIYPNQYSGSTYDASLASGETLARQSFVYGEVGAGVLWAYDKSEKSIAANNDIKAQIGFSTYHLNRAKQNFLAGINDRLYMKYVFHGNILIGVPNSNLAIQPSWLLQLQGPSIEIIVGALFKYYLTESSKYTGINKRSSFGFGVYYRNADAFIALVNLDLGKYVIAVSYDFNTSGLTKVSSARGGFEVTLKFMSPTAFLYQKKSKSSF